MSDSGRPSRVAHNAVVLLAREIALRAIIFDFNSVIADDETSHPLCVQQALTEAGRSLSKEEYDGTYLGTDGRTCTTHY